MNAPQPFKMVENKRWSYESPLANPLCVYTKQRLQARHFSCRLQVAALKIQLGFLVFCSNALFSVCKCLPVLLSYPTFIALLRDSKDDDDSTRFSCSGTGNRGREFTKMQTLKRRRDGRESHQLRPLSAEFGIIDNADGSARLCNGKNKQQHTPSDIGRRPQSFAVVVLPHSIRSGNTNVIVAVYGPRQPRSVRSENPSKATLDVTVTAGYGSGSESAGTTQMLLILVVTHLIDCLLYLYPCGRRRYHLYCSSSRLCNGVHLGIHVFGVHHAGGTPSLCGQCRGPNRER